MIYILCIIHVHYAEQLYESFMMEIIVNKYTYILLVLKILIFIIIN